MMTVLLVPSVNVGDLDRLVGARAAAERISKSRTPGQYDGPFTMPPLKNRDVPTFQ